jgi:hypothetical protein
VVTKAVSKRLDYNEEGNAYNSHSNGTYKLVFPH